MIYIFCTFEGDCVWGEPLTITISGPMFEESAELDPIAKKPGGRTGLVTPTLTVHNLGS